MTDNTPSSKDHVLKTLKSCPFCGGEALLIEHPPHTHSAALLRLIDIDDHPGSWSVECCDVGLIKPTRAEAIAAWNRRADPLVEELRGALERAEHWFRDYERQHRAKDTPEGNLKADTNGERADYLREALALPVGNISARDLAPQPEPLTVPETPRHADALQDRIGERIADEVEKACHGRQTNCEQAAADILAMLKGGAS